MNTPGKLKLSDYYLKHAMTWDDEDRLRLETQRVQKMYADSEGTNQ